MGLAASQARLISLEARMSDTEYEGQQINQQRQVLTNKMNEVYNQAMDMEVPTPPSKIDFALDNAFIGSGKFKGLHVYQEGVNQYHAYQDTGSLNYVNKKKEINNINGILFKTDKTMTDPTYTASSKVAQGTAVDQNAWRGQYFKADNGTFLEATKSNLEANGYIETKDEGDETSSKMVSRLTKELQLYTQTPGHEITDKVPADNTYFGEIDSVRGQLSESLAKRLDEALAAFKEALGDNVPEKIGVIIDSSGSIQFYDAGTTTIDKDTNSIEVYTTESLKDLGFVEPKYDSKGNIYAFVIPGYSEPISVSPDGTAYDELKYNEAYVQYEREKIQYDRDQNQFNKQTSIYQRQDKQLELKLTRLDNERNALNTEIDAVKKVIQDATEKGFKTFSG